MRRLRLAVIFNRACAFRQRQRKGVALGDLARPDRNVETVEHRPRLAHERRFGIVAPRRHAVDHDRVGLLQLAGGSHGFLDGGQIEQREPRRNDDQRCQVDGIADDRRHVWRRVNENPLVAVAVGLLHGRRQTFAGVAHRRFAAGPELVPQLQRSLRIGIEHQHTTGRLVRLRSEMSGQRALARAAFARGEDDDVHERPLVIRELNLA